MKKISILLAFVLTASVANAWSRQCDEAVVIVANKYLNPTAKKVVKKYLGKSFEDDVAYLYDLEKRNRYILCRKKSPLCWTTLPCCL